MIHYLSEGTDPKEAAKDADILTMGITPSGTGDLHLGHLVTLYNLLKTLDSTGGASSVIYVDDREFSLQGAPHIRPEEAIANVKHQVSKMVSDASDYLGSELSRRVEIVRMSDFIRMKTLTGEYFGEEVLELFKELRAAISHAFRKMRLGQETSVMGLCPECHSGHEHSKRVRRKIDGHKILSTCLNSECPVADFDVDVSRGEDNWAIFYAFVCLRDILMSRHQDKAVTHFFGGDYALPWAQMTRKNIPMNGASKIERMSYMLDGAQGIKGKVNQVVGPLLTVDGRKLSKSHGDKAEGVNITVLETILGMGGATVDMRNI